MSLLKTLKRQHMNKLLLMLLLSGCATKNSYQVPDIEIPCQWHTEIPATLSLECEECFPIQDPNLNELLELASSQNLDLQIACIRVLKARSIANGKKGDLYPRLDATFNAGTLQSKTFHKLLKCPSKNIFNFYEIGFDAEWEIDFFGKTAHEICALQAEAEASQSQLSFLWITLSAEIAKNYIELRGLQEQKFLYEKLIGIMEKEMHLREELIKRGLINEREFSELQSEMRGYEAELPLIELAAKRSIHKISILLGLNPGELFPCLEEPRALPQLPYRRPIGLPSELLQRRPDIQKAEWELMAATEQVSTAIAALFPRLSLWGFIGEIGFPSSFTSAIGSQILVPLFNSRLLLQDVAYNKLSTQEALFNYKKTVLEALEEAENAISSYRAGEERLQFLEEAYAILLASLQREEELHQKGVNSYLEVAKIAKQTLAKEEAYLKAQKEQLLNYLSIYKAMGGCWNTY